MIKVRLLTRASIPPSNMGRQLALKLFVRAYIWQVEKSPTFPSFYP